MNASLFMRLSAQVTVADLAEPLQASTSAAATLADAQAHLDRHRIGASDFAVVRDGGSVVGWVEEPLFVDDESADVDEREEALVQDVMRLFDPGRLLTADTPARRALTLVAEGDPFEPWFVLDGHEFVGTIDYDCFFKPPFRVCLFALATQLEQRTLWLCARKAEEAWEALPEHRRIKALEAMRQRRKRMPKSGLGAEVDDAMAIDPAAMLGYTTFIDKKTIVRKLNLLPSVDQPEVEKVFDWMESLRNFCAHPDTYEEPFIEPQDLVEQITACERLLHAIEEQLRDSF